MALKDVRQTSTDELALFAFYPSGVGTAATGLSTSDGTGDGDRGSPASDNAGGTTVRLGTVTLPGVAPAPVTANQLREIMPHAGAAADRYVDMLNQAMATHGINTPAQRAAFLAQVSA